MQAQRQPPLRVAHSEPVSSLPPRVSIPLPCGPGQLSGLHGGALRQQVGGVACVGIHMLGEGTEATREAQPCSLGSHIKHLHEQCQPFSSRGHR